MGSAVTLRGITKQFPDGKARKCVLKSIDWQIAAGELVFLTGPSGSGKSTLLNVIGLLEAPDSGSLLCDGCPVTVLRKKQAAVWRRTQCGFIYQNFNLVSYLNVLDNILLPYYTQPLTAAVKSKALEIMQELGIRQLKDSYPLQCSGGEKQRIAIARALLKAPGIILADEPTGELDGDNAAKIMQSLRALNREMGVTLVIVTHNQDHITPKDRVCCLKDGAWA